MKSLMNAAILVVGIVLLASLTAVADEESSIEVKPYGYVKLDGAYDQNLTSHGNFVMWVKPRTTTSDDEQFNMTANETRLGLNMKGSGYSNVSVAAKIECDLYASVSGGVAENKAMLQLRHAYFSITSGQFTLLAGQTWDLISPLNPSTLNYPVLWGCGNTGYRRPQIRFSYNAKAGENTSVNLGTGFFRTIGSNLTPTLTLALNETSDGSDDGTDAGIPSFQAIFDVKHTFSSKGEVRFGVSGLYGEMKAETNQGNSQKYESRGVWGHFMMSMPSGWGFSGEAYTGSNLGSYFGGVLQSSTIDGVSTVGGWTSAWAMLSKKVKFTAGLGIDDPKDDDIASGRSRNQCVFGNLRYFVVPRVTLGLEVSQWETDYKDDESVKSMRAQTSFIMSF